MLEKNFFGDAKQWYSFKPPNYHKVINLEPIYQTVWQVMVTNLAIETGLNSIDSTKVFTIDYEKFCQNPQSLLEELCHKWKKRNALKYEKFTTIF